MKRISVVTCLSIMMAIFLIGCGKNATLYKEAKKQYNAGKHVDSFHSAVEILQEKPQHKKALLLMDKAYPFVISEYEDVIETLMELDDLEKYGHIAEVYNYLLLVQSTTKEQHSLYNPKSSKKSTLVYKDYSEAIKEAKQNAAEYHYQNGMKLKNEDNTADKQKLAAKQFKKALYYIGDYKDARMHFEECRKLCTTRIAVMPFPYEPDNQSKFGILQNTLEDRIISSIINTEYAADFVQFITRCQIDSVLSENNLSAADLIDESSAASVGILLGADEILSIKVHQVVSGPLWADTKYKRESKTVKIGEETYVDKNGKKQKRDIMGDIYCNVYIIDFWIKVDVEASYSIFDASDGQLKYYQEFQNYDIWRDVWARVDRGNPDALSTESWSLSLKSKPEPPLNSEMINNTIKKLAEQMAPSIRRYVN